MSCLVVGGAGFIGSKVSNMLSASGRTVIALGRAPRPLHPLSQKVKYVAGDYKDRSLLRGLFEEADELIDLAYATVPKTSFEDPVNDILSNLPAGVGLIQEASLARLKKMIFVSSGGTVYGVAQTLPIRESHPTNPISPYGITKLTLEKYVLMFVTLTGLPAVIVRPGNAYGEQQRIFTGQGFVAAAIQAILRREPVNIFGSHGTLRDYLYVEDLARGIVAALQFGLPGDVYNIGSGIGLNNLQVLETIERFARPYGYSIGVNLLPERGFDVPANVLDSEKLTSISGWKPQVSFEKGFQQTWMSFLEKSTN